MRPQLRSISLDIDGYKVAAIRQRDPNAPEQPRLLCVHGWLDNANSFLPMMPYLPAFDLVAIDLPGHGYSDALPGGYTLQEFSYQLTRIIQSLGWSDCHVMGHSLGGCITPLLAVANKDIVSTLTLVEASGPLTESADQLPARMARSLEDRLSPSRFQSRVFASKDDATASRMKAAKILPASARLIIDRQLIKDEDGYRWRFDPRWRMASVQYQTEEQVRAVLAAIECPVLTVLAEEGYLFVRPETEKRLNCLHQRESVTLPGNHHLHMDTPEPVATAVNRFLGTLPAMGG